MAPTSPYIFRQRLSNGGRFSAIDNGLDFQQNGYLSVGALKGDFDHFTNAIGRIDNFLQTRGIKLRHAARYRILKDVALPYLNESKLFPKAAEAGKLRKLQSALIDLMQLTAIIDTHQHLERIPEPLRIAFFQDSLLDTPGKDTPGRDMLFQYYASARFRAAGCDVKDQEPDLICKYKGTEFGVAVKRCQAHAMLKNAKRARDQIYRNCELGVICIDLSQSSPLIGPCDIASLEAYRSKVSAYLEEKFFKPIHSSGSYLKNDDRRIPLILGFHICAQFFNEREVAAIPTVGIFNWTFGENIGDDSSVDRKNIYEVGAQIRATLPGMEAHTK